VEEKPELGRWPESGAVRCGVDRRGEGWRGFMRWVALGRQEVVLADQISCPEVEGTSIINVVESVGKQFLVVACGLENKVVIVAL
jgi:hypothetical protein